MRRDDGKTVGMNADMEIRTDMVIVGAGPVGALAAALAAQAGLSVTVIEAGKAEIITKPRSDGRAIALALAPKRALEVGGFWPLLSPAAEPILDIRVTDGHAPVYLHYDHRVVGTDPFGWIIENEVIKTAALERLRQLGVRVLTETRAERWDFGPHEAVAHLAGGGTVRARLAVAADGRKSPTRDTAGIEITGWDYGQSAIVCAIGHEKPHRGIAHEHFRTAGPFAILPMTDTDRGHRSGIVWTEARKRAQGIVDQTDGAFLAEMAEHFGDFLGELSLASPRFAYPLTFQMARKYTAKRLVLVGDAAHGMHPIAGQGLNLGLRDAAALGQVVVEAARLGLDIGGSPVLDRYRAWRRMDTALMMGVTDSLNKLFTSGLAPVKLARDIGLWAVEHTPPLKTLFMRHAMGVVGDLPRPLKGEAI